MTVLSIIAGIILIIGGFACMMTPVTTFLSAGYFLGFMMIVYGVAGLIKAFQGRSHVLGIIVDVLSIIVGVFSIVRPGGSLALDHVILIMVSCWFIIQGVYTIYFSVQTKEFNGFWVLGVIVGVLGIILGIYSFLHPAVTMISTGILIGFYFVESGIDLIMLAGFASTLEKQMNALGKEINNMRR